MPGDLEEFFVDYVRRIDEIVAVPEDELTLEVLDKNDRALRTYTAAGFKRYALQPGAGEAIFLTKSLN